jgi:tRNA-dihydrouridine synthase
MNYYLAPMEGLTGYIFRNAYHTCFHPMDKYFTPFLTPKQGGDFSSREKNDILPEHHTGMDLVPQLLTNRADAFLEGAARLREYGYEEINLNLGCPSGTVVSKGKGAGFLKEKEALDRFLFAVSEGLVPLNMKFSVKTRLGMEQPEEFEELLSIYNQYPITELIIHPRVREDYYKNSPRMEYFRLGLSQSKAPVCYNGDIFCQKDLENLKKEEPSLKTVMLGRGILANPFFLEAEGKAVYDRERLRKFHGLIYEGYRRTMSGDRNVLFKMKELWFYLSQPFCGAAPYVKRIKKAQKLGEYEAAVEGIFRELDFDAQGGFKGV